MSEKNVCERCGKEFQGRKCQRYCSKNCADRASQERCGGSENAKLELEYCIEQAQRRQDRMAMKKRLAERDAAFAAAYPLLASGSNRGTRFSGTFGKREYPSMVDVATHKEEIF